MENFIFCAVVRISSVIFFKLKYVYVSSQEIKLEVISSTSAKNIFMQWNDKFQGILFHHGRLQFVVTNKILGKLYIKNQDKQGSKFDCFLD